MKINPLFIALVIGGVFMTQSIPRNMRNNNPLNIRKSSIKWEGLADEQKDKSFATFVSPEYGYRAAFKILKTYSSKYHLVTLHDIISRWAPPSENDTEAYIKFVGGKIDKEPHSVITPLDRPLLIKYMTQMEGGTPGDMAQIKHGEALA